MLKRFSISLENNLLDKFDRYIKIHQYHNRSEAIRDLIRKALLKKDWQMDKQMMGVISLTFSNHHPKLQEKVTRTQRDFHHQIVSSTNIHLDHNNCIIVIVVCGKAGVVQQLANRLLALRGIRDGNLAMSSTDKALS